LNIECINRMYIECIECTNQACDLVYEHRHVNQMPCCCEVWWLSGKFGAFGPESHSSRHAGPWASPSLTVVALRRVNSDAVSTL